MAQFLAGGGIPKGADQGHPPVMFVAIAGGLALVALSIRFMLIPKIATISKMLPAMIVGLALSEAIGFLGMFLIGKEFPTTRLTLFAMAVACIACLAPIYVNTRADNGRV